MLLAAEQRQPQQRQLGRAPKPQDGAGRLAFLGRAASAQQRKHRRVLAGHQLRQQRHFSALKLAGDELAIGRLELDAARNLFLLLALNRGAELAHKSAQSRPVLLHERLKRVRRVRRLFVAPLVHVGRTHPPHPAAVRARRHRRRHCGRLGRLLRLGISLPLRRRRRDRRPLPRGPFLWLLFLFYVCTFLVVVFWHRHGAQRHLLAHDARDVLRDVFRAAAPTLQPNCLRIASFLKSSTHHHHSRRVPRLQLQLHLGNERGHFRGSRFRRHWGLLRHLCRLLWPLLWPLLHPLLRPVLHSVGHALFLLDRLWRRRRRRQRHCHVGLLLPGLWLLPAVALGFGFLCVCLLLLCLRPFLAARAAHAKLNQIGRATLVAKGRAGPRGHENPKTSTAVRLVRRSRHAARLAHFTRLHCMRWALAAPTTTLENFSRSKRAPL